METCRRISDWIVGAKAVSQTFVEYSFIQVSSIKQVKMRSFQLEAVNLNPQHAIKGDLNANDAKQP